MLHQTFAHIPLAALHQREHPRMQPQRRDGGIYRLRHNLGRAGMGGMALDHHRAPCRKRRRRVTARRGKSQREV